MFDVYCETPSDSGKIEEKNGSEKSENAKSRSFTARRPFCLCFVRAGVLGESSVTPKSSSGDHERESWIGIPLFNFRMFNYLTEMKKKE